MYISWEEHCKLNECGGYENEDEEPELIDLDKCEEDSYAKTIALITNREKEDE